MRLSSGLLILVLLAPYSAQAAVSERDWEGAPVGNGLLTFDNVNNREWLDLTETQLFNFPGNTLEEQYAAVVAETDPNGLFDGFTVATSTDVFDLADSAGIITTTTDFDTNQAAASILIDLLGETAIPPLPTGNKRSRGLVASPGLSSPVVEIGFVLGERCCPFAGVRESGLTLIDDGVWLYRQIPEPSNLLLITSLASMLLMTARWPC